MEPIIKSTFQILYFFSGQMDKTHIPFIIQKHQNHKDHLSNNTSNERPF